MNGPQLIIFDLDGTLLDTLGDIAAAANHAMCMLGQPAHRPEDYRMMIGEGADVLVRKALPVDQQHLAPQALSIFKRYYGAHPWDTTVIYDGIAQLLDDLTSRGVKLAVLTNKLHEVAVPTMERFMARWDWLSIRGHRPDAPKKPDPAPALAIAAEAHIPPARCAFIGDSRIDILTAVAAGMFPIGVTWGYRDEQELRDHGARIILHHPRELLEKLDHGHALLGASVQPTPTR